MSFFVELKRRNVIRVALAYGVFGWLVLQVADVLFPALHLPEWGITLVAVLLAIGFVFALVFAWVYELTPEGVRREREVEPGTSVTSRTGRRLDLLIVAMLVVAIALLVLDPFGDESGPTGSQPADGPPVVAVLPFKAVGSDDGGLLAAGLHDDLLTLLAKIGSFRVISRTSMMEYAVTAKNMREIGEELGADYILEGGVQARGERVRINAQLIQSSMDEHIWAETYDRNLTATDLFDVQSEIAQAISKEMQTSLTPEEIALVESVPTENTDSYNAYLRAARYGEQTDYSYAALRAMADDLEEAVRLDPDFTLAWARLSDTYSRIARVTGEEPARDQALTAFANARMLEPELLEVELAWVVYVYHARLDFDAALRALERLGNRAEGVADAVKLKSWLYRRLGRFREAYDTMRRAARLSPRDAAAAASSILMAIWVGDCAAAARHVAELVALDTDSPDGMVTAAEYELNCGDPQRAVEYMRDVDVRTNYELWTARAAAWTAGDTAAMQVFAAIDQPEPYSTATINDLIFRGDTMRTLGRDEDAKACLEEATLLLDSWDADRMAEDYANYADSMRRLSSVRRDAGETLRWYREYVKNRYDSGDFDHYLYTAALPWDAVFLARAGLHDEAVAVLRDMFEASGGRTWRFVDSLPWLDALDGHPGFEELRAQHGD